MGKKSKWITKIMMTGMLVLGLLTGQGVNASSVTEDTEWKNQIEVFANSMRNETVLDVEGKKNVDDMAVFPLYVLKEEKPVALMHCFYVTDGARGREYLLSSPMAAVFAEQEFVLQIYYKNRLYDVKIQGSDQVFSYLECAVTEKTEPISMAKSFGTDDLYMVYAEANDQGEIGLCTSMIEVGGWKEEKGYFNSGQEVSTENIALLGIPCFDEETGEMSAMLNVNAADGNLICTDLTQAQLSAKYGSKAPEVEKTTEDSSEPEGNAGSENDGNAGSENDGNAGGSSGTEGGGDSEGSSKPEGDGNGKGDSGDKEPAQTQPAMDMEWAYAIGAIAIVGAVIAVKGKKGKSESSCKKQNPQPFDLTDEEDFYNMNQSPAYGEEPMEGTIALEQEPIQMEAYHTVVEESQSPKWQIRGMSGVFQGQTFALQNVLRLGRNPSYEIPYPEKTKGISGSHCELSLENGRIMLRDLGSTYGTYLDKGEKLNERISYELKEGDIFYLAEKTQSFRVERIGESRQVFTPVVKAIVNPKAGQTYHADAQGRIQFGRNASSQVSFPQDDMKISTNHCVLYREGNQLYLMDLGSTNGTFLSNDQRLRPHTPYPVQRGSSFYLTSQNYLFVITEV